MTSLLTSQMLSGTGGIQWDSGQLAGLLLRLPQPERHVHLAIQAHARCEMVMRLLTLRAAPIELGKADVAVGGERTHAQVLSEGKGFPLVANRDVEMRYRGVRHDFTEDMQGSSFVPSLPPPPRGAERFRRELGGFVAPPRPKVGVGELRGKQSVTPARGYETLQAFFQERNGVA